MSTANFHKFRIFLRPGVQQMPKRQAQKVRGAAYAAPVGKLLCCERNIKKRIRR